MSQPTIKLKPKRETTELVVHQVAPHGADSIALHCELAGAEVMAIIAPDSPSPRAEFIANGLVHGPATSVAMVVFCAALKLRGESQADAVARLRCNASGAGQAWAPTPQGGLRTWLEGR